MGIVKGGLKLAVLAALLALPSVALHGAATAEAKAHRTTWDLAQFTWLRLAPREKGAAPNEHPAQVSAATLIRELGAIRAATTDGEEALFAPQELAKLAGAMEEALALADPGEDLLLLSGNKRGAGFFASPLAVAARLFVKDGRLNLLVQDARLEVLGRYSPQSDWPQFEHGSRTVVSKALLTCPGAVARRADWLVLATDAGPAAASAAPVAPVPPAAVVASPAPVLATPAPKPAVYADQETRLRGLKRLLDERLITEQEYQAKREAILKSL